LEFHIVMGAAAALAAHPSQEGGVVPLCAGNVTRRGGGGAGQGRDLVQVPEAQQDGRVALALVPLPLIHNGLEQISGGLSGAQLLFDGAREFCNSVSTRVTSWVVRHGPARQEISVV